MQTFPLSTLRQGNRHGDIQATNVFLVDGDILFLDFDLVHRGYPLLDYVQAAALYLRWELLDQPTSAGYIAELYRYAVRECPGITRRDLAYLVGRILLGPIQGGEVQLTRRELVDWLHRLEHFCERIA